MLIEDLLARAQAVDKPNGCPRPSRRGPHTSIVMRWVTVRQDAPEWVIPQVAALLTGLTQAWRRRLSTAGVVIECPRVEHRAGSIDGWLDPPPQEVGDCPVLSIRGWDLVYSLAVKA